MSAKMAMTIVACGDLYVSLWVHTTIDPPLADWKEGLDRVAELKRKLGGDVSKIVTLAVSDGGAPNSVQRGELFTDILEGKSKAAAISSQLSNRLLRGIATAIFWLNPNFRAFPPEQFDLALTHVGLLDHRGKVVSALQELQKSVEPLQTLKAIQS